MCRFRKRESPIDRRVVEEKYRNEQRGQDGFRPGNFRERNAGIERNDRFDRPRGQSPRGPPRGLDRAPERAPDRERIDKRQPEPDFRRDRRDDANQGEWRNKGPGNREECVSQLNQLQIIFLFLFFINSRSTRPLSSKQR